MIFLSCDWGSTTLRLRAVHGPSGEVLREWRSPRGSSGLTPPGTPPDQRADAFARALAQAVAALGPDPAWGPCPVVASGMVTSAHGWLELPYARTPLPLDGTGLVTARTCLPDGRPVILVSGLSDGKDVMRGEECELLGLTQWPSWPAAVPAGEATVVFPGTHCKHVRLERGEVTAFRTFMTGELLALLRQHSVLRYSLPAPDSAPPPPDPQALEEGALASREGGLSAALFQVRTRALLQGMGPAAAAAFLSGALIAAEFDRAGTGAGPLILAAGEATSGAYRTVLERLGLGDRLTVVPSEVVARSSCAGHALVLARQAGSTLTPGAAGVPPPPATPGSKGHSP